MYLQNYGEQKIKTLISNRVLLKRETKNGTEEGKRILTKKKKNDLLEDIYIISILFYFEYIINHQNRVQGFRWKWDDIHIK